jgi:hypothetical protein
MADIALTDELRKPSFGGKTVGAGTKKGSVPPSSLLCAMRWVFEHSESEDTTEAHRNCRELLTQDRMKFIVQLDRMERQHRAANEQSRERAGTHRARLPNDEFFGILQRIPRKPANGPIPKTHSILPLPQSHRSCPLRLD